MNALTPSELEQELSLLAGWSSEGESITKGFLFANFQEAFAFMTRVAFIAEKLNHHPSLENVYNRVRLTLTTHDAGNKVTSKDVEFARLIDAL